MSFRRDVKMGLEKECNVLGMTSSLVNAQVFSSVFKSLHKVNN